ncbi:uncharacterized protein LOC117183016 [Belonocnema kinseyi]|uniref:uncharacterized protein LOC117183016 n=1 Tax=Belonocnema kinseyi TaxID=2817044 RepID=UPI00143D13CA|nr:uncharacterized protein LOC117183016 [Belonocnema kinseyi]
MGFQLPKILWKSLGNITRAQRRFDEARREFTMQNRISSRTKPYLINLHCQSLPFRIGCILRSSMSDSIGKPCPLRRGGATGRANRLTMYDDKEMTMHAMGPPLGQVAPGWFLRCPGERESLEALGTPTTYLPTYPAKRADTHR